jgi:hypothetical protein
MAVPNALRLKILERDNYTCVLCNACYRSRPMTMEVDHKTPLKEGGTNDPSNLRTLCMECNRRKGSACPECLNCHKPIDTSMTACQHCGRPIHAKAPGSPDLVRSIARWVLLVVGVSLLAISLGSLAWNYGSSLIGKFRGTYSAVATQSSAAGAVCKVSDNNGRANLKSKCDSLDCDNDQSTVAGKIASGTSVTKTGRSVSSELPSVGEWSEVLIDGKTSYLASSKLVCP